ncbi:MAG: hypothetical protein EPN75_10785 [Beijerinckiaceae bacterium]|nr:MAG: hypothetical protein EPN75_10785 [Beijerinckiaceae bacterium]
MREQRHTRQSRVAGCVLALLLCLMLAAPLNAAAETAHSLGQVPSLLKTPESKQVFKEQMEGKPAPDKLGIHLPTGLTAQEITSLLLPADGKTPAPPLNTVGAKPLPGEANLYVAIVCTGGDIPTSAGDMHCNQFPGSDAKAPLKVRLGLIEAKPGEAPKLAAKPVSVDGSVDWSSTGLSSAPDALDQTGSKIHPQQYDGFDLAPYRISASQRAFGLRGEWFDGYSGGMGSYSALYLFAAVDGALKMVLAVPMSSYKDIAGDWHKDGTRDHDITQAAHVLIVSKHSTNGHFDLELRNRTGHWRRLYQWSATAAAYRPAK